MLNVIAGLAYISSGEGRRALANIGKALESELDQAHLRLGETIEMYKACYHLAP